jgi:hypothetical protein
MKTNITEVRAVHRKIDYAHEYGVLCGLLSMLHGGNLEATLAEFEVIDLRNKAQHLENMIWYDQNTVPLPTVTD